MSFKFTFREITPEDTEILRIYFYITKEDLAARRFDRIWLILQCY